MADVAQSALEIDDVSYRYAGSATPALDAVSFAAAPGEVISVVGPSGSGKSTLLRVLCGLLPVQSGRVLIRGDDVTTVVPERRPVAMVFQGYALLPHLSVADNIGFGLRLRGMGRAERGARVSEVAATLGIEALLGRLPSQVSGGERQRVVLARALVRDPAVFCLDEPLSSLDAQLRVSARRDLAHILRRDGRCAVYVTHDQVEAMGVGDRVAVLNAGRVEQVGTPFELYARPATAFVAGFVGTPPMSLLPGDLPWLAASGDASGAAQVGVRAEDVRLDPVGDDATVLLVDVVGHEAHVTVERDGASLVARTGPDLRLRPGQRVGVAVAASSWVRFGPDGRTL